MKIIFEVGDIVEIEDNMSVPCYLAASHVELLKKLSFGDWKVKVTESFGPDIGTICNKVHESWFCVR